MIYDKETTDAIAKGEVSESALDFDNNLAIEEICDFLESLPEDEQTSRDLAPGKNVLEFLGLEE